MPPPTTPKQCLRPLGYCAHLLKSFRLFKVLPWLGTSLGSCGSRKTRHSKAVPLTTRLLRSLHQKFLTYIDDYSLAVVVIVRDWMEVMLTSVLRVLMDPLILMSIDLR